MTATPTMTDVVVLDGSTVCLRQAGLVTVAPEIQELDLNPVIVLDSGAHQADARVRIQTASRTRTGRRIEY